MSELQKPLQVEPALAEQHGPPMPKFLIKIVNPLVKLVLNSPLHRRMSQRLMVLSFTGKKSGKRYSTPVGYVRQGGKLLVFTHSAWRGNFTTSAPVTMRLQGKQVAGSAQMVKDPERIRQMIKALAAENGEQMSRQMGFWVENLDTASPEEVQRATRGTYFIEIETSSQS